MNKFQRQPKVCVGENIVIPYIELLRVFHWIDFDTKIIPLYLHRESKAVKSFFGMELQ